MTPAAETKDGGRGRPRANPSLGTQCRLWDATDRSYLANRETRGGRPARIILGDPMPEMVELLPVRWTPIVRTAAAAP